MVYRRVWACTALLTLISCAKPPAISEKGEERVQWAGHNFREVTALHALPPGVQTVLGVGKPGLDGIADPGGKYNITDVVDSRLPTRRFLVAGVDKNVALVAVERGGIGWSVQVTLYSNTAQTPFVQQTWSLFESPGTLRALVDHLRSQHEP
jgi:hypothetical protein